MLQIPMNQGDRGQALAVILPPPMVMATPKVYPISNLMSLENPNLLLPVDEILMGKGTWKVQFRYQALGSHGVRVED